MVLGCGRVRGCGVPAEIRFRPAVLFFIDQSIHGEFRVGHERSVAEITWLEVEDQFGLGDLLSGEAGQIEGNVPFAFEARVQGRVLDPEKRFRTGDFEAGIRMDVPVLSATESRGDELPAIAVLAERAGEPAVGFGIGAVVGVGEKLRLQEAPVVGALARFEALALASVESIHFHITFDDVHEALAVFTGADAEAGAVVDHLRVLGVDGETDGRRRHVRHHRSTLNPALHGREYVEADRRFQNHGRAAVEPQRRESLREIESAGGQAGAFERGQGAVAPFAALGFFQGRDPVRLRRGVPSPNTDGGGGDRGCSRGQAVDPAPGGADGCWLGRRREDGRNLAIGAELPTDPGGLGDELDDLGPVL